jgi:rhodanese-related sulfurtransferase
VFSGGSLIVGAAARTDLVDPERTRELAYAQYQSLRRLTGLPDQTLLWPTHGAGSFCAAPPGTERVSSIGAQKVANALLAAPDADAFADLLIGGLGEFPAYFLRLAEANRTGPPVIAAEPALQPVAVNTASSALGDGAVVVDVRPVSSFAAGHVPGALSIVLRPQFATWLGWLVEAGTPWIVVRDPGQDTADLLWQALKIGHPAPLGELSLENWDGPLATLPLLRADQIAGRHVIDVRQPAEYEAGHIPGAVNRPVAHLHELPDGPSVIMCGHGERAATAASLLRGGHDITVLDGGPADWAKATGRELTEGP